jgi:hypothetical protein
MNCNIIRHLISCSYRALLDVVEITNTMHRFALLLFYMLAATCFGRSLPSSGSFWIRLSYLKLIDLVVDHIMWLSGMCAGVSWFCPLCLPAECICIQLGGRNM